VCDGVAVSADNPKSSDSKAAAQADIKNDRPLEGAEGEDFFQRVPSNFRWPKPNAEALAAAAEAIQRMSGIAAAQTTEAEAGESGNLCSACGGALPPAARFCFWCGVPTQLGVGDAAAHSRPGGQHHFHHHYHHFASSGNAVQGPVVPGSGAASGGPSAEAETSAIRGRAPGLPGATGGRAEAGARKVVQDWAQACNTRHIDDLLELYATDATLIRPSVPPVRSLPAIREFLIALLEAGLGDVEMESMRVEMLGEIAIDLGRCKMLVPVAMGKRREERGKYLIVLVRQPAGTWKILADCWSADLTVNTPTPEPVARKGSEPIPPLRKPR